jgi:hypothetical protein
MWLPELSVKKTDKLRPFLNFQLQVTSSYFKFFVIARRHPIVGANQFLVGSPRRGDHGRLGEQLCSALRVL